METRFGQYRQLAGGQHNVFLRQIYKCEKKIRLLSVLKLKVSGKDFNLIKFELDWADFTSESSIAVKHLPILLLREKWKNAIEQYLIVLTYIAGYCSFSVNKKLQCKECKLRITYQGIDVQCIENTLISGISKGSLLYPSRNVVDMIVTCYLMVNRLAETKELVFTMSTSAYHSRY